MGNRLRGKRTLVTGAGSGIGRAIALRFAREGASVLAVDVNGSEQETAAQAGPDVIGVRCDVSVPEQVAALEQQVRQRWGGLDVLANNAGVGGVDRPLHDYPLDEFDRVMAVNVRGAFLVLRAGLRLMLAGTGGAVVNSASISAVRAIPRGVSAYVTSKGAIAALTRQTALEYAGKGIRVNAIAPGAIDTPAVLGPQSPPHLREMFAARIPQGRVGTAEEVAALVLFLASDEASHITGQTVLIDGGRSTV